MKKTRFQKSWSMRNVPDDIWPELLSRLPVKSLLRFRCVSRSWKVLIDDPHFARLHLTRFTNNRLQPHLFVVQGEFGQAESVLRCCETFRITARLGSPQIGWAVHIWEVVSSTDGLFMVRASPYQGTPYLMLWNPSIRKTLILPLPPPVPKQFDNVEFGLGFDPLNRDYKYVRLIRKVGNDRVPSVAVYTLGTNSWKTIEFKGEGSPNWRQHFKYPYGLGSFCLRGVLYTLARDHPQSPSHLFSFDLSSEMFSSTRLPVEDHPCLHSGTDKDERRGFTGIG